MRAASKWARESSFQAASAIILGRRDLLQPNQSVPILGQFVDRAVELTPIFLAELLDQRGQFGMMFACEGKRGRLAVRRQGGQPTGRESALAAGGRAGSTYWRLPGASSARQAAPARKASAPRTKRGAKIKALNASISSPRPGDANCPACGLCPSSTAAIIQPGMSESSAAIWSPTAAESAGAFSVVANRLSSFSPGRGSRTALMTAGSVVAVSGANSASR